MTATQKAVGTADNLVGRYVLRQSREAVGKQCLGLFCEVYDEDKEGGWVYDFATREYVRALASHCVPVPKYRVSGGLRRVPVTIPLFGTGVVEEELFLQGQLRVRIRFDNRPSSMLVNFMAVEIKVPPRV